MRKLVFYVAFGVLQVGSAAFADVAMPRGQWTPIRMASEHVKIVIGATNVQVSATFVLENEKDAASVVVGYPRGVLEKSLENFAVTVDGQTAAVSSQKGATDRDRMMGVMDGAPAKGSAAKKYQYQFDGPYPEWKTFTVSFAAKQKRTVVVSYSVAPAAVETESGRLLTYVYTLKTGATWSGNIGSAVIEATLDGMTMKDLVSVTPKPAENIKAAGPLVWQFKDFKPTQDIEVTFKAK